MSEFLRLVLAGEAILVTRLGEIVAELHKSGQGAASAYLLVSLAALLRQGSLMLGKEDETAGYRSLLRLALRVGWKELLD